MTTIPSPAEFLTAAYPDDEHDEPLTLDELVADLQRRVTALESSDAITYAEAAASAPVDQAEPAEHPLLGANNDLREVIADLRDKHGVVLELVEEIRAIVKPSTSKVSLQVKAAIDRWANPLGTETPSTGAPEGEPDADGSAEAAPQTAPLPASVEGSAIVAPAVQCSGCARYFDNVVALQAHGTRTHGADFDYRDGGPPAHDASVEEWQAYARTQQGVPEGTVIDSMNRSQIRTMLGIEQPAGA